MGHKLNMMILLVIFSSIDQVFSAVFMKFETLSAKEYYFSSRSLSNHRGLFLSYSSTQRNKICTDLFSEKVNAIQKMKNNKLLFFRSSFKAKIRDSDIKEGKLENNSLVGRISAISKLSRFNAHYKEVFFKCVIEDLPDNLQEHFEQTEYFVSTAFATGLMFAGRKDYVYENEVNVLMKNYMLVSPDFVSLKQEQLEKQYLMTRIRLKALEKESAAYIKLIEHRDDISELSTWQTFLLCSSIIFAPEQKTDLHKISIDWPSFKENAQHETVSRLENKPLAFRDKALKNEIWTVDCVHCWPSDDGNNSPSRAAPKLFFTRSIDDKHSVYVLKQEDGKVYLSDYIRNVPVLMNVRVPITDDPPPEQTQSQEVHH